MIQLGTWSVKWSKICQGVMPRVNKQICLWFMYWVMLRFVYLTKEEIIPMVMILHNNEGQIILITLTLTCNNTMHEHFWREFWNNETLTTERLCIFKKTCGSCLLIKGNHSVTDLKCQSFLLSSTCMYSNQNPCLYT